MKIPKQKAVVAVSDKGVEYIKLVDIRYPFISYILSLPLRALRITRFQLQIMGVFPVKRNEPESKGSAVENSSEESKIALGEPKEQSVPFQCLYKGKSVSGQYIAKFLLIHPDLESGTDVLEFTWKLDDGNEVITHHAPDYFLRQMSSDGSALTGAFANDVSSDAADDFLYNLLVRDSKALVDDRNYADIKIGESSHEVHMKYIGLEVSLASSKTSESCMNALLCGVMEESDILPPFILSFPLELLIDSNSTYFDEDEKEWV